MTTKETEDQSPADALVDNDTIATNEATSEPAAGNNNDDDDGDVSALTSQLKETTVEETIQSEQRRRCHHHRLVVNPIVVPASMNRWKSLRVSIIAMKR